jgi:hypothetical protein
MATPKQSISADTDLRRAESDVLSGAVVTVENGDPTPKQVFVDRNGTVQFVNKDSIDYRLRLWTRTRERHPDVDVLLSGRGGVTVIVDQEITPTGECYYELFPFEISELGSEAGATRDLASVASATVEALTIEESVIETVVGDASATPANPPEVPILAGKLGKGPGGGIITVP